MDELLRGQTEGFPLRSLCISNVFENETAAMVAITQRVTVSLTLCCVELQLIAKKTFAQFAVPDPIVVLVIDTPDAIEFQATIPGDATDNPTDPDNLTLEQMSKSVGMMYLNVSSFCVTLCIGGPMNMFGRNLIFSGLSDVFDTLSSPPPISSGIVVKST